MTTPKQLYKYVSFDRLSVVRDECIRITQPAALNDPWELKPYLEALLTDDQLNKVVDSIALENSEKLYPEAIKDGWNKMPLEEKQKYPHGITEYESRFYEAVQASPEILAPIKEKQLNPLIRSIYAGLEPSRKTSFLDLLSARYGVLSLAEKNDNDLMWPHYGSSHTGMALEFNTSDKFFNFGNIDDPLHGVKPVNYSSERPTLTNPSSIVEAVEEKNFHFFQKFFFTKSRSWSYEQEWRLVRKIENYDNVVMEDKEGKPLDHRIYLFNLPATAISGIIVGAKMPDENRQAVCDLLRSDVRYSHIKLSKAVMSSRTFALSIEPL